jgi:hypothetical protein
MSETMAPRAFVLTAQQLIDDVIALKAGNAYYRRSLAHADDVVTAERENTIRTNAQLDGFKAANAKLDTTVGELQEALAAATAQNANLERIYTQSNIGDLVRRLDNGERQLAASRSRAAELQRRLNAAAAYVDTARLMLVDTVTE